MAIPRFSLSLRSSFRIDRRCFATSGRTSTLRSFKFPRRTTYALLGLGAIYFVDKQFNASSISRNCRTLWTCAMITIDYKLNFTPEKSELIPELHERVANRMWNLFTLNGGLYIKIGQAIGANAALLPKAMQVKFAKLFDDAPQIPLSTVKEVFQAEFGRPPSGPGGMFEIFQEEAVASASIAQVHKAKLWPTTEGEKERWVAVKVQKPDVRKQMEWDLGAYRAVMWMFEHWAFDLPVYFVVDFISDHLRAELDFVQEAANASQTAKFIASEPLLANKVHIPKVYPEFSTKRIMTAEWIEGVRLSDKVGIRRLMGEREPKIPNNTPSSVASAPNTITIPSTQPSSTYPAPLKGGVKSIMKTMVELFSAQMFSWGWVHCDPHPGNIIIRPHPSNPTLPQLVLLDHGLYVQVNEEFRRQYAQLWKGLLGADWRAVENVSKEWGIGTPDLFASATLMKPVKLNGREYKEGETKQEDFAKLSQYEQSVRMKAKLKMFLTDTDKMPKALIFLGRNMRMVQGNNQSLGSPVNRIKITGYWASRSLTRSPSLSLTQRLREYWYYMVFRSAMISLDIVFWASKARQWVMSRFFGRYAEGFEEELERSMRGFAKSNFGVEVAADVFEG